jgi:predicted Fe-S protein YdhL (DUF1289 family)
MQGAFPTKHGATRRCLQYELCISCNVCHGCRATVERLDWLRSSAEERARQAAIDAEHARAPNLLQSTTERLINAGRQTANLVSRRGLNHAVV